MRSSTDEFIDMLEDHFETAREFLAAMAAGLIRLQEAKRKQAAAPSETIGEAGVDALPKLGEPG